MLKSRCRTSLCRPYFVVLNIYPELTFRFVYVRLKKVPGIKLIFLKWKKKCLHKVGLLKQFNDMSTPSQKKKNMTDLNRGESERRSKLPFLIISIFHSLVSDANNCDRVRNECSLTSWKLSELCPKKSSHKTSFISLLSV